MTYTKCPFCGEPIRYLGTDLFTCDACHIMLPAKHWLAYINTRKALDVATGFIKGISETVINDCDNQYVALGNFKKFAEETLSQIKTALEQKEAK